MSMKPILQSLAQLLGSPSEYGIPNATDVGNTQVGHIINLVLMVAGAVSVVTVIIGGILYALSTGDSAKTAKAKDTIIYAIIGLIIVSSAFAITNFIIRRV